MFGDKFDDPSRMLGAFASFDDFWEAMQADRGFQSTNRAPFWEKAVTPGLLMKSKKANKNLINLSKSLAMPR